MKLEIFINEELAGWGEIRDLGQNIAGLGGFGTAESYRGKGIYWRLMDGANDLVDQTQYGSVAVRIMAPYVAAYLRRYPGFHVVKENDEEGADWLLRMLTEADGTAILRHLEKKVKKW